MMKKMTKNKKKINEFIQDNWDSVLAEDFDDVCKEILNALGITDEEINAEYIIPAAFDKRVGKAVAAAVAESAKKTGVARI